VAEFDAIVLAGGAGRRLGGAVKPEVRIGGVALVDRALAAVRGARRVVLVAPPDLGRPGVLRTLEDPPLGGPVAGVSAGLAALVGPAGVTGEADEPLAADTSASRATSTASEPGPCEVVVVLACDVPRAGSVVGALVAAAAAPGVDGARLVDRDGRAQHLVAAYRRTALDAALARLGEVRGASVRALVADLVLVDVPDPGGAADDADTWEDVRRLDAELACTEETDRPSARRGTIGPDRPDTSTGDHPNEHANHLPTDRRTP
jgi:molybdopterin-guanine dinucleotide biosynthesis protein A